MKKACRLFVPVALALLSACHGGSSTLAPLPLAPHGPFMRPQSNVAGTYANVVLGNSPTQYFQLNDTSGPTARDASVTGVNGAYVGPVTNGVTGPLLNEASTAISLPGGTASEGVSLPNPVVPAGTSFSVQTWVYPVLGPQYMTVWGFSYTHRLLVNHAGHLVTQFNGTFTSARSITTNKWHDIVFVYNAQTATQSYYIDGTLDSSAPLSAATFASGYYLGQYDQSANYKWQGDLAQHALFTTALNPAQISALYTAAGYGPMASPIYTDWSTFGDNLQRTNYNPNESTITAANASALRLNWSADLGSAVTAQPILASGVPVNGTAHNLLYVGTEGGVFYALDADTGKTIWSVNLGTITSSCRDLPGGIFGITGTATFDKASNRVYVADGNDAVHALDLATGQEANGWPVTISANKIEDHVYGALSFNPANGLLYVETASFCDRAPWHGLIAAINTTTASVTAQFLPGSPYQGAGIWGTGGAAIDPASNDVYVATGNTITGPAQSSADGEKVVQLDADLNVLAANYPGVTGTDVDFGGTPMIFKPGACAQQVSAKNKSGFLITYFANGISSSAPQKLSMAPDTPVGQFIGVTAYSPITGLAYVGNPVGNSVFSRGINALAASTTCSVGFQSTPVWQNAIGPSGVSGNDNDSPTVAGNVVYLTDGVGNAVFAFDAASGAQLWNSGAIMKAPAMNAATVDGRIFVSSWDHHLYAFGL